MSTRAFDLIGFDADDTLWHNERSYRDGRDRFRRLLVAAGVTLGDDEIADAIARTEAQNLAYYGYGVSSFVLSLIETAVEVSGGRIGGGEIRDLIGLAKQMFTEDVELFEHADDVLSTLSPSYPLMLVTKGDLRHQTSKLERSGLRQCFRHVEVVSDKTPSSYASILARYGVEPRRFLMVGNSLRSDVLPVLEVGGCAVHVPAALSWAHDHVDPVECRKYRYFELPTLAHLTDLIERLERGSEFAPVSASD